jgi:hypothetical protein
VPSIDCLTCRQPFSQSSQDTCNNEVRSKFTEFGCSDATEAGCLCKVESFRNSVRDCSTGRCTGTTEGQVSGWFDTNFCAGIPLDNESATSAVEDPAATTTSTTEEDEQPTTSAAVEETVSAEPTPEPTSEDAGTTTTAAEDTETATSTVSQIRSNLFDQG